MHGKAIFLLFTALGIGSFIRAFGPDAQAPQNSAPAAVSLPVYPESARGLEKLVEDLFQAAKKNDAATYSALISSLARPVPDDWFQDTFGDEGDLMFKEYPGAGPNLVNQLQAFFVRIRTEKFTEATAQKHEASCDDNSGEMIYPVMVMRQGPVPLYELRFHQATSSTGCGPSRISTADFATSATFALRSIFLRNPRSVRARRTNLKKHRRIPKSVSVWAEMSLQQE